MQKSSLCLPPSDSARRVLRRLRLSAILMRLNAVGGPEHKGRKNKSETETRSVPLFGFLITANKCHNAPGQPRPN